MVGNKIYSGVVKSGKNLIIKKEYNMIKNYNEIMEMRANGMCESCGYGFDRCLTEGKAFCLQSKNEKEDTNEEESV